MKYKFHILIPLLLLMASCEKGFEETNKNPFEPTVTTIGPLFNQVVSSLRLDWNEQFYLYNEKLYEVTQLAALTSRSFQNITIGTEGVWGNYYSALANIRDIERRFEDFDGDPEVHNNIRAQLKILLAYKTFKLTDLFGDIPFFEAGKGFESVDYLRPKFDEQEAIYRFLLEELDWAVEHINPLQETADGVPYFDLGNFDTLLDGDLFHWVAFANSLRLKHALRMVEADPDFALPIITEILENDLDLIDNGEDVVMLPDAQGWQNEGVHWSFREHRNLRLGSNIWKLLSETDAPDGSGIFDPRAAIFFEGNADNDWVYFPQLPDDDTPPSGGSPYQGQRDTNYNFKGAGNIYASFNYYLIRDDRTIPEILMTAAEIYFIKAEIYLRGLGVAQNTALAEGEYTTGVVASMTFWQNIFVNSDIWENHPAELTQGQLFGKTNHPKISIFTSEQKAEFIYQQRWLHYFRQPWEAFALQRRTNMTPHEGPANNFFRFAYPPSEAENNPDNWSAQVAKMGRDDTDIKVWWMK